jgi:hypothetical protein
MGWITLKTVLMYVLPGFIPTFIFYNLLSIAAISLPKPVGLKEIVTITRPELDLGNFGLYLIASIIIGIMIDMIRHVEGISKHLWKFLLGIVKPHTKDKLPVENKPSTDNKTLAEVFKELGKETDELVALWMCLHLKNNDSIHNITKEYPFDIIRPEFTNACCCEVRHFAGLSLLQVIDKDSAQYVIEEPQAYYAFAFNMMIAIILTALLGVIFYATSYIDGVFTFTIVLISFIVVAITRHAAMRLRIKTTNEINNLLTFSILKLSQTNDSNA